MTTPPDRPYIPYPFPPYREPPERKEPLLVPIVYEPAGRDPVRRLYERRTVLLGVVLDSGAATDIAAELMSLDGRSGQSIELLVNSPGGPIEDVFAVLDVIALLRAPVTVTCFGRALGTAAVPARQRHRPAAGDAERDHLAALPAGPEHRRLGPGRRTARAEHERTMRDRIRRVLQERTRLPAQRIEHELDHGGPLDATTVLDLGVIDEIVGPGDADCVGARPG